MVALVKARLSPGVRRRGAIGNSRLVTAPVLKPRPRPRRTPDSKVRAMTPPRTSVVPAPKGPRVAPNPRYNV